MKTVIILFMIMAGAAALMPVEIAQEPDAGLDAVSVPVDASPPDMSPAAPEDAILEADASIEVVFAELRHELARLDSLLTRMDGH